MKAVIAKSTSINFLSPHLVLAIINFVPMKIEELLLYLKNIQTTRKRSELTIIVHTSLEEISENEARQKTVQEFIEK
ncbi:CLUMA_CG014609, isoform A [Clunio marinus]|uniref:CLUMA_CG014609, isoform A n=1 Tax=Clunio marinus TaxID=568069 RepID=A0A1J1IPE6_9DIPT|nr:CLUMA_CG014609, isoform A [Clunio marinus]